MRAARTPVWHHEGTPGNLGFYSIRRIVCNDSNYCSLISTSTPAGKSSFISASTVLSVGSTISIRR